MKWSQTLIPTMKETPTGAEIPSHIYMLRAGMISQVMAGAYAYLPLGWRALQKATNIVRDEMDKAGGVELFMTALCPQSLYEQTDRVEAFGNVLIKTTLVRGGTKTPVVFCPTHEEEITNIVSQYVSSYRQLPLLLYQIQTKFRNEERPKFGVLRTSEFLMKDAYSFHTDLETLDATYKKMYDAYCKIFTRCGLDYIPVEAESGPIGGEGSHEFMIPSKNGEDDVVFCSNCKYAANVEKAEIGDMKFVRPADAVLKDLAEIPTPGAHTIEQVCAFLKAKPKKVVKTLIYSVDGTPVAVLVRGDCDVNENKLRRLLQAEKVEMADEKTIERVTGAPVGFAGPVGLKEKIKIIADPTIKEMVNVVVGANKAEAHLVNVNLVRDFTVDLYGDVRNALAGDACPRCGQPLAMENAIEVGHVFKLGTKYSDALNAKYLDENGSLKTIIMGCYGIGVSRIIAGLAETSHDDFGIIWPVSLAPYEICVCPVKASDPAAMEAAEKITAGLQAAGCDVILDDRDERPGVKFKDADLIGFPVRVTIGKGLADGNVEIKWRWDSESTLVSVDDVVGLLAAQVKEERVTGERFTASKNF
ncbi:MAG: proline--tRNA ligase [Thermoguttaceae bacterium]|jgi:prolyl-tRNA synthetase|nr:proline--tRNA ligase [Thermoguttaceae bacterium]